MTEDDLEPLWALVSELEQTRLGARWKEGEDGDPVPHEPTAQELLDALYHLYWFGRNVYDGLAAKIEGARPFRGSWDGDREPPSNDDPDAPF